MRLDTQTIKNKLAIINGIQKSQLKLLNSNKLPDNFCEAFAVILQRNKTNIYTLEKLTGIFAESLKGWAAKTSYPTERMIPKIKLTEIHFELAPGTLVNKIKNYNKINKKEQSRYGKFISKASKNQYAHRYKDWSDKPKSQFNILYKSKTKDVPSDDEPRKIAWRLRSDSVDNVPFSNCPTANLYVSILERAFGLALLPIIHGGLGLNKDELDFSLFKDFKFIEKFATEFIPSKSFDGRINGISKGFSNFCSNLTTPEYGLMWQQPELFQKNNAKQMSTNEITTWREECSEVNKKLLNLTRKIRTALKSKGGNSRSTEDPIRDIINNDYPLEILHTLIDTLQSLEPESYRTPRLKAAYYRDLLILMLLEFSPLRTLSLAIIKIDINLIKIDSGWKLKLSPNEIKNGDQQAARGGLDLNLPEWINKVIDKYLALYDTFSQDTCDRHKPRYLIRCVNRSQHKPVRPTYISERVKRSSENHLDGSSGFRAHAFRHILATHIIRNMPGGEQIAADVLLESVATVRENYSHVKPGELHKNYRMALLDIYSEKK